MKPEFDFICFDTEDNSRELMLAGKSGFDKQVTQIAAIKGNGAKFYNRGNVPQFLAWLKTQPEKFVYAHNLQYDLGNLFRKQMDCLDVVMVGGRIIKATLGKQVFVDSFNIWPMSVKKIGDAFGLKKLETVSMANDKAYVFRDVEIIWRAMAFAWKIAFEMGLDHCPATLGGLCMKLWRGWGGENCHDSTRMTIFDGDGDRAYYYGGRVELFKQQNETDNVCYTDINSLYPYVMTFEYPGPLEQLETKEQPLHGIVKATVKIPNDAIPALPYRDETGRILFPVGKVTGAWTLPELRYAEKQGVKVLKVHDLYGSNETFRPYVGFVERLYKARLAAKTEAEKLFFKLLMNNLYGRLGTRGGLTRTVYQNEHNSQKGVPYGRKVLLDYLLPLDDSTNWCHAAYVTGYGRMELHGYMKLIGPDRMIYCDTDSTIFDCPGKAIPFPIGDKLGQMKLVQWSKFCETYGPKRYLFDSTDRAKGVPKNLACQFNQTGSVGFDLPYKFRESARMFDFDATNQHGGRLSVWRDTGKEVATQYDKKILKKKRFFPLQIAQTT